MRNITFLCYLGTRHMRNITFLISQKRETLFLFLTFLKIRENYISYFSHFSKMLKFTFLISQISRNGNVIFLCSRNVSFLPTPDIKNNNCLKASWKFILFFFLILAGVTLVTYFMPKINESPPPKPHEETENSTPEITVKYLFSNVVKMTTK